MGRSPSGKSEDEAGVFGGPTCLFSAPSLSGIPDGRPRRQAPESPSQGATVPLPGPWANQGWLSLHSENVLSNDTHIVNSSNNKEQNCEKESTVTWGSHLMHTYTPLPGARNVRAGVFSLGFQGTHMQSPAQGPALPLQRVSRVHRSRYRATAAQVGTNNR